MRNRFALLVATVPPLAPTQMMKRKNLSVIRASGREKANIVALNPSDGERHHMCWSAQSVGIKKMNETQTFGFGRSVAR
jgi:hypothetical protein